MKFSRGGAVVEVISPAPQVRLTLTWREAKDLHKALGATTGGIAYPTFCALDDAIKAEEEASEVGVKIITFEEPPSQEG